MRGEADYCGFKLSQSKLMSYLRKKVDRVSSTLDKRNVTISGGSSSALFSRSSAGASVATGQTRTLFAIGLLGEYLDAKTVQLLTEEFGLDAIKESPAKKQKTSVGAAASTLTVPEGGSTPLQDYSLGVKKGKVESKTMSTSAKALAKVDKKGMKSMMSFFGKKK